MQTISKKITALNGKDQIKIHGLKTGRLAIKQKVFKTKSHGKLPTLFSFMDKEFCDWLPVWTWVIEHPEGTFLIDTGLTSEVHQPDYFKPLDFLSKYYFNTQMKFEIKREEEIDYQLKKIGLEVEAIDKVIMTHLHIDHVGGFRHLKDTPILINETEWIKKDSSFPQLYPPNLNVQTIKLEDKNEFSETCHFLTTSKDLMVIPTPGDTRGHVSIGLLANDKKLYLFAGDVAYNEDRLKKNAFSATIASPKENAASCEKILGLTKKLDVIFLPTHDSAIVQKLENDELLEL